MLVYLCEYLWDKEYMRLIVTGTNPRRTTKLVNARARRMSILAHAYLQAFKETGAYADEESYLVLTRIFCLPDNTLKNIHDWVVRLR